MERKRSVRRRRYERPFAKKCKEYFRQFVAFLFSNVGIIGLVLGYTIAGALIFQAIEGKHQIILNSGVVKNRTITAHRLYNITLELNPATEVEYRNMVSIVLQEYQKNVVNSIRMGYIGSETNSSTQWSFSGAFLYSLTVITTIGYGNIFPATPEGKITTIIYAIIGMPLFLLYLSNIGDIMARSFKWIYANCCLCRWCPGVAKRRAERRKRRALQYENEESGSNISESSSSQPWQVIEMNDLNKPRPSVASEFLQTEEDSEDEEYDVQTVTVPITICLLIMVGYICGGALLFCKWENWEFLDASYFCFISLSTIGFGDFVPGDKIYGKSMYKEDGDDGLDEIVASFLELGFIFCSMYLMLGMALIAMCFNLMQEEVIHKIRTTVQTVKYVLRCNR